MALRDRQLKQLLQWLVLGTRGGANRAQIIKAIREEPRNANQLGRLIGVDYRTIRHHLDVLEKNGLIKSLGDQYGKVYFLSTDLEENFRVFEEIWNEIGKKLNSQKTE